ncbi:extracellular solute-binding protein [Glycomyces sp. NRRL B-16210]|uniref:extracellular solute-binding protein n=1 Tax=Glycomyces sp. NRRL B-16210 TaxID=1463821 RepID=UPI0004BF6FF1|nr:extracellular solute-binding protein [Glycomyces sp. NRRL B-16210]
MDERQGLRRRTLVWAGGGAVAGGLAGMVPSMSWQFWQEREDLKGEPLKILSGRDDTADGQRRLLVKKWNDKNKDHQAELVELPGVADLQYNAIHAALQSGDTGVDAVVLDLPWIAEFAAAGRLRALGEVESEDLLPAPLEAGRYDGDLYALPFNTDVGMLYYRKGEVTDPATGTVGPEDVRSLRDWDGLRECIGKILGASGDFKGGIAMQLASYEGFIVNVWEYLLANGVRPGEGGRIRFGEDSDAGDALGRLVGDLYEDAGGGATVVLTEALQHTEDDSLLAFQSGLTPFLRHWPRAHEFLRSCEAGLDFEVGAVPMPGAVLGGQSLAVNAASKRPKASKALIEFLTDSDSQQELFDGGFGATREGPYRDAFTRADGTEPEEPAACVNGIQRPRPDAEELYAALTGKRPDDTHDPDQPPPGTRPAVQRYTQYSRAFREYLHPRLRPKGDPDPKALQRALDRAIAGK